MKKPKQPTEENGERHYNWCPCQECEEWANALLDWDEARLVKTQNNYYLYRTSVPSK
jgi:hypothetical protein